MKMHSRRGRPRKDSRAEPLAVKRYDPGPPDPTGPLSGEQALQLIEEASLQDKAAVVARICGQVAASGARRLK